MNCVLRLITSITHHITCQINRASFSSGKNVFYSSTVQQTVVLGNQQEISKMLYLGIKVFCAIVIMFSATPLHVQVSAASSNENDTSKDISPIDLLFSGIYV